MLIHEVMTTPAITVTAETTVAEVLRLLDEHDITAVPVVDRHGYLVGVLSEADLLADATTLDQNTAWTPVHLTLAPPARRVGELMTHLVVSVDVADDVDQAADLMTSTMVKSLPVLEDARVVGVVSRRDLIHVLATRDERIRDQIGELLRTESDRWSVEVTDGTAVISGPATDRERRLASVLASSVAGVTAVRVR